MTSNLITFIGGGNMAQALIGGLLKAGSPASNLIAADPSPEQQALITQTYGIAVQADNAAAVSGASAVVLAVKPQVMTEVLNSIRGHLDKNAVVISVAAGITLGTLAQTLGEAQACVRAMPNTPALYGAGIAGLVASKSCRADDRKLAESILAAAGRTVWISEESQMDAVTAVSGSGPAYFFAFTEHLAEAGMRAGLSPETALKLARQTAIGAGRMLAESDLDPAQLRRQVTSPGGTTEAALKSLAASKMATMIENAVAAATRRARELGES